MHNELLYQRLTEEEKMLREKIQMQMCDKMNRCYIEIPYEIKVREEGKILFVEERACDYSRIPLELSLWSYDFRGRIESWALMFHYFYQEEDGVIQLGVDRRRPMKQQEINLYLEWEECFLFVYKCICMSKQYSWIRISPFMKELLEEYQKRIFQEKRFTTDIDQYVFGDEGIRWRKMRVYYDTRIQNFLRKKGKIAELAGDKDQELIPKEMDCSNAFPFIFHRDKKHRMFTKRNLLFDLWYEKDGIAYAFIADSGRGKMDVVLSKVFLCGNILRDALLDQVFCEKTSIHHIHIVLLINRDEEEYKKVLSQIDKEKNVTYHCIMCSGMYQAQIMEAEPDAMFKGRYQW